MNRDLYEFMSAFRHNSLRHLVDLGYCIGCGLCVGICKDPESKMAMNDFGFYEPKFSSNCINCDECNYVCPFGNGIIYDNPGLTEDKLFEKINNTSSSNYHKFIGYFNNCFVGFSHQYRISSSSGGIATWVLTNMLEHKIVDRVICVVPTFEPLIHFTYKVCSDKDQIVLSSRSHYFPINLSEVIKQVIEDDKRYAIVGLPCFLKGIRLAQIQNKALNDRIVFTIGLFCGGMKSRYFTEYLGRHLGITEQNITNPIYRRKREGTSSRNYYFQCRDKATPARIFELSFKKLGDLWGPGYFKHKACDYCDDITAECADISLGDAWIQPYQSDWRGYSIIITRSKLSDNIISEGYKNNSLFLEEISIEKIIQAQSSNFNHRLRGLSYRLYWSRNKATPHKRVPPKKPESIIAFLIYKLKSLIRENSLLVWHELPPHKLKLIVFKFRLFPFVFALKLIYYLNKKLTRTKKITAYEQIDFHTSP